MKPLFINIPYQPGCPFYYSVAVNEKNGMEFHQHSGLELIWLHKGKIKVTIEQIDYDLQENDVLLVNHFDMHRIKVVSEDVTYIQLHMDSLFIQQHQPDFYELFYDVMSFNNSNDNQAPYDIIRTLFSKLIKERNERVFLQLVDYVSKRFSKIQSQRGLQLTKDRTIIQQILNEIENDFKSRLTLNEIAKKHHYNPSYLSDLFKKQVGISFKHYVEEIRNRYSFFFLINKETSITNIALASGFPDEKSYYKSIKNKYAMTPSQMRQKYQMKDQIIDSILSLEVSVQMVLTDYASLNIHPDKVNWNLSQYEILADVQADGSELVPVWKKIINVGSANTLLNQNVREQIREIQSDIHFEYIRFEGIFNQEMEVVQKGPIFNWKFVNDILDYLQSIHSKPFIVLSYMPPLFASSPVSLFNYQGNTSPPKDTSQWLSLVQSLIVNCINRYGHEVVKDWYFQIWTEVPAYGLHWSGTLEQYLEFYRQTALLIKGISPNLKVGPASENFHSTERISETLLQYCHENNVPIDFYSSNIYHNQVKFEDQHKNFELQPRDIKDISFKYQEKNHSKKMFKEIYELLSLYQNQEIEFIVTRWNFSWDVTNSLHDTAFMAAFVLDNMLHPSASFADAVGFLSASDILYEWRINHTPFYGGSGLMNTEGVKKAAYYGFSMLSKLGSKVISQGENYIVTKHGEDIQLLVYNSSYPDQTFIMKNQLEQNPYDSFEETNELVFNVHINHIYGIYKYKHYSLNQEHGSAFDEWIRMGEYPDLGTDDINYIKNKSGPSLKLKQITFNGDFSIRIHVPVHGVECVLLNKIYN
ncbi:MAG TPA: helix-turn-helix domain-containing protein [Metabacillus sp.]|nr:helix-turn-helix domain-containing protein [Metabacillus sp.]